MPVSPAQKEAIQEVLKAVIEYKSGVGRNRRQLSDMFMELVDRETWAEYYEIIPEPRCLEGIKENMENNKYKKPIAAYDDMMLVFLNALYYNEEGSQIAKDAEKLKTLMITEWTKRTPLLPTPPPPKPPTPGAPLKAPTMPSSSSPPLKTTIKVPAPPAASSSADSQISPKSAGRGRPSKSSKPAAEATPAPLPASAPPAEEKLPSGKPGVPTNKNHGTTTLRLPSLRTLQQQKQQQAQQGKVIPNQAVGTGTAIMVGLKIPPLSGIDVAKAARAAVSGTVKSTGLKSVLNQPTPVKSKSTPAPTPAAQNDSDAMDVDVDITGTGDATDGQSPLHQQQARASPSTPAPMAGLSQLHPPSDSPDGQGTASASEGGYLVGTHHTAGVEPEGPGPAEYTMRDAESDEVVKRLESGLSKWEGFSVEKGWMAERSQESCLDIVLAIRNHKDQTTNARPAVVFDSLPEESNMKELSYNLPLSLKIIEGKLRMKTYATSKEFDIDMARLFEKGRRWYDLGSEHYGNILILQRLYQSLTSTTPPPGPPYTTTSNFASLPAGPGTARPLHSNPNPNDTSSAGQVHGGPGVTTYRVSNKDRVWVDEVEYKGWGIRLADWLHLANPDDPSRPIVVQVFKCWVSEEPAKKGQPGITVCWYYRPEQTFHPAHRQFWEGEVFKTSHFADHPLEDIIEKIAVQFTARHIRGRPRPPYWYPGWPLYVCDSRYNDRERVFVRIKNWNSCIPEEVRKKSEFMPIFAFEKTVFPRRFGSPFLALKNGAKGKVPMRWKYPGGIGEILEKEKDGHGAVIVSGPGPGPGGGGGGSAAPGPDAARRNRSRRSMAVGGGGGGAGGSGGAGTPRNATTNEAGPSKGLYVGVGTGVPATPAHHGAGTGVGATPATLAAALATPYNAAAYASSVNMNGSSTYATAAGQGQVTYPQTPYGQSAYAAQTPYTGQSTYSGQVAGAYPSQYSMHYSGLQYGQMPAVGYPGQYPNPYDRSHRKPFLQHPPPVDRAKIERLSAKDKEKDVANGPVPFADRDPFVNGLAIFSVPAPKLENIKARIRPPHHSLKYMHWAAMRNEEEIEEFGRVLTDAERAQMLLGKAVDGKEKGKKRKVKWWIRTTEEIFDDLWEEYFGDEELPGLEPDPNVPLAEGEDQVPAHSPGAEAPKSPEGEVVDAMEVDSEVPNGNVKVAAKPKRTARKGKRGTKRKVNGEEVPAPAPTKDLDVILNDPNVDPLVKDLLGLLQVDTTSA